MCRPLRLTAPSCLFSIMFVLEVAREVNAADQLPDALSAGVPKDCIDWTVVTRSQTTNRYGRRVKMRDAI
jgi:hypothetical protein